MDTTHSITDYINLLGCDTARISRPLAVQFLIIGWNRHTKNDRSGKWYSGENGEPLDFAYVKECCVASGTTDKELWESAKEYKRLRGMQMIDYLREIINTD